MAAPSVTRIYPSSGPTGGRRLVQVMGGGFQLPPDPPALGPAPASNPTVGILFGGARATRVQVASEARLFAVTPATPLDAAAPAGPVDVVVRNVDQAGVPIPGESVTVVNGYAYVMPDLSARPEADLVRLVRALLQHMKQQIMANVSLDVHTDWSADPVSGLSFISELPAVTLHGPDLAENRFYSTNERRYTSPSFGLGSAFFDGLRSPYTVDLRFELLGVTDRKLQSVALQREVVLFFHRNKLIGMRANADDPTSAWCEWEVDLEPGELPTVVRSPNSSNLRAFRMRFLVRGFDLDEDDVAELVTRKLEDHVPSGSVAVPSAVQLGGTEQTGVSYLPGPSPGE